tara:strand:- start:481 stop:693 length:213 start_codon:yes stop_codon:yes gene_type:complete
MINKFLILIIKIYQNTISYFFPSACRFTPSCSQYMIDAINKYGKFKGAWMGLRRISSCHPHSNRSGYDPA